MTTVLDNLKLLSLAIFVSVAALALSYQYLPIYTEGYIAIALVAISFQLSQRGKPIKYLALALVIAALCLSESVQIITYPRGRLTRGWYEGGNPPYFYQFSTIQLVAIYNAIGCLIHFLIARVVLQIGSVASRAFRSEVSAVSFKPKFSLRSLIFAMTLIALTLGVKVEFRNRESAMQFLVSDLMVSILTTFTCIAILNVGSRLSVFWRNVFFLLPLGCLIGLAALSVVFSPYQLVHRFTNATIEIAGLFALCALHIQAYWAWIGLFNITKGIEDDEDLNCPQS